MPALLLYLLQVNVGLALFYATYQLVLRQTTFHHLNRLFLAAGLLLSGLFPFFDVTFLFKEKQQLYQTFQNFSPVWSMPEALAPVETGFDVWLVPVVVFWLGVGVMGFRFGLQWISLYTIHRQSKAASFQGIRYRQTTVNIPPFSFWKVIYFNPDQHPETDWWHILQHERTHVQQWHTLDILLMELTTLFHWFNPVVWLFRKALKQNLEFLTDQQTLQAGIHRKQYQFSLLNTAGAAPLSFTSSFSYPSLKHRIMMMNKAPSAQAQKVRFLAVLPLLFSGLIACQGIAGSSPELGEILPQGKALAQAPQEDYNTFLERNPTISRVGWNKDSLFVHLKTGQTETYPTTREGLATAERKYGTLPPPPPPVPGPPVPAEAALAPAPPPPPFNVELPQDFKKRNPTVAGLSTDDGSFHVILKSGDVESFDFNAAGIAAFEKKYGTLPPPPPPVAPQKKVAPQTKKDD